MVNKLQKIALTFLVVFLVLQPFGILTAQAQAQNQVTPPAKYANPVGNDDFACGTSAFTNCIAAMVYYIGPGLASWAASISSYYFSLVVKLSLNSTAYALTFISDGWTVVRDIANMTFIFLLIYIALTIMFQAETTRTMQMLAAVIAVALLVNFSFYLTRVVIDAGNILAVQFYNALPNNVLAGNKESVKDLSFSIMSAVNLQGIYGSAMLQKANEAAGNSAFAGLITVTVIYLSVAAMFWMLFFSFVTAGIKFMLRIVGLWFVIISSPLAFISWTIPAGKSYFKKWFDMLWQYSIYPAVYLFMFLILSNFAKTILLGGTTGGGSLVNSLFSSGVNPDGGAIGIASTIANVGIRMGFVIAMLHIGLKVSDWVVTEGSSVANKVTGFGLGGTTKLGASTFGFLGRSSAGLLGANIAQSSAVKNGAKQAGLRGSLWRGVAGGANKLSSATYDPRNIPGGGLLKKGVEGLSGAKFDAGKAGGSIADKIANRMKENEQKLNNLKPSPSQIQDKYKGIIAELEPERQAALKAAAEEYARIDSIAREDRTEDDKREFKRAKAEFTRQARIVIDSAKSQANAAANEFIDKKAKNTGWSAGSLADIGFVNKQRSKEKTDAEKIKDILAGFTPPAAPTPVVPVITAALTRSDMEKSVARGLSTSTERLMGGLSKVVESIDKNTSYTKSQAETARTSLKEFGKNGQKTGEVLKKINENIINKNKEL